jgi:hypothetical protein
VGIGHGHRGVEQQLVPQYAGHLHGLLDQAIARAATAHGGLIPLGHGIGDAAHQGPGRRLAHQGVVEHQQLGAALQCHVMAEGPLRRIHVGQGRPAGAGGRAGGNGDAGQIEAIGQQLAGIEHLAAAGGDHRIAATAADLVGQAFQVGFAAVVLEGRLQGGGPDRGQVVLQLLAQCAGGVTAAQEQRSAA